MNKEEALATLERTVRASGLIKPFTRGVVLVSGGPDSACVAAGLMRACGAQEVQALHLNYGLRPSADHDEQICRDLCAYLRINLQIERPKLPSGNTQAAARDARYAAAQQIMSRGDGDWIATGHTRSDLAETVLYRLAASPGRRALLGLPARRGPLIRPLLALDRAEVRAIAEATGLPFADDPTNDDPRYARNRIRNEIMPVLRELNPAIERNIAETQSELGEEAQIIEQLVGSILEQAGLAAVVAGPVSIAASSLADHPQPLRRLVFRELAERAAGRQIPLGRARAVEIWKVASSPEGGMIDLGSGLRAVCEYGQIRFTGSPDAPPPDPVALSLPGQTRFGRWNIRSALQAGVVDPGGLEQATIDASKLDGDLIVRAWREGDRMNPIGLGGTKALSDIFSDARVPRSIRDQLPVVTCGGQIVWVAGVAFDERFKVGPATREVVLISASAVGP